MNFKFCPECGFKFDKEYKFCPECGYKLDGAGSKKPEPLFDFSDDTAKYADDNLGGFDAQLKKQQQADTDTAATEEERKAEALRLYEEEEVYDKKFYIEFAEKGDPVFQYIVGTCYSIGENDRKTGVYWYEKAAKQGNADGQYHLGGYGVTQDKKKAKYWYEKAAAQGNYGARRALEKCNFDE